MKITKKALSLVLAMIMSFSVLAVCVVGSNAVERDSGKHYILPAGTAATQSAQFALGETVYGKLNANTSRFYMFYNDTARDITFSVVTDKAVTFTVTSSKIADSITAVTTTKSVTLTGAPIGTYFVEITGTGAAETTTEYYFTSTCTGLATLGVNISKKTAELVSGDTLALQLSNCTVNNLNFFWESIDNPLTTIDESKVVSVNDDGLVTVAMPSKDLPFSKVDVTVRAVAYYSTNGTAGTVVTKSCTVTAVPANIELTPYVTTLNYGINVVRSFTATTNVKNATLVWKSSDLSVALVDNKGTITTVGNGQTEIEVRIKYNGVETGVARKIALTVNSNIKNAKAVAFANDTVSLRAGEQKDTTCVVTMTDNSTVSAGSSNVVFKSADEKIATVSKTGRITGVAKGETIVTATTIDGEFIDTCVVKVSDALPNWLTLLVAPIQAVVQLINVIINWIKSK
ncbi:MAG TPA: hypothetical protein DDY98_08790 [Ruminococcaceae bacterium]|nr:hypothetical protein [Oscillospiraceae bacterium]